MFRSKWWKLIWKGKTIIKLTAHQESLLLESIKQNWIQNVRSTSHHFGFWNPCLCWGVCFLIDLKERASASSFKSCRRCAMKHLLRMTIIMTRWQLSLSFSGTILFLNLLTTGTNSHGYSGPMLMFHSNSLQLVKISTGTFNNLIPSLIAMISALLESPITMCWKYPYSKL